MGARRSSPLLKLAATQGSHQSQLIRKLAGFSRNNKIISRTSVRQAALLKSATSGLFECQDPNQLCSLVKGLVAVG
jgi:hypothetical protein